MSLMSIDKGKNQYVPDKVIQSILKVRSHVLIKPLFKGKTLGIYIFLILRSCLGTYDLYTFLSAC